MSSPLPFRWLALVVAAIPVVTGNLCYVISASADFIPDCFIYADGCTSISATGRHGVCYWLFKALMLPQCVLLVLFWRALAQRVGEPAARWLWLAWLASAFLVVYVLALGSEGDLYRLMRRYGVFVFFIGTFALQILTTRKFGKSNLPTRAYFAQVSLLVVMTLLALAEIPLGTFGIANDQAENIIEWNFALLMQLWFATWWFLRAPR